MRLPARLVILVLLMLCVMPLALADDSAAPTFDTIASASPVVSIALALAYGAYQIGQAVSRASAALDALLTKGIPIRVDLSDETLDRLSTRRPKAVA